MNMAKRTMDIFFSLLLIALLAPVGIAIALLLLIKQGRPVFYVAERMKSPTQSFGLWKFRTMSEVDHDSGVSGADKSARVTAIGRRLRSKRLDELPQLWNILKGDISFVGPRPPLREYVERFPETYARVLATKPGVTGLATLVFHQREAALLSQSASPAETDAIYCRRCIPRKARLDLIYIDNQSLCLDFVLVFQTIGELLSRKTARLPTPRASKQQDSA